MKTATLAWQNNTPQSLAYDDIYYSSEDGLTETQYVFLKHNRLPQRWQKKTHFTIIETGFGTGLNFLATWQLWDHAHTKQSHLHFISVEKNPLSLQDLRQALSRWSTLAPYAEKLIRHYPPAITGFHHLPLTSEITLTLLWGDAVEMLSQLVGTADAWFLDGFAPSKNPDMWSPGLMRQIVRLSYLGTTFATFTAASTVRKALASVGFEVKKAQGFGKKREMLYGSFYQTHHERSHPSIKPYFSIPFFHHGEGAKRLRQSNNTVAILGAGLAGCATAYTLNRKGIACTIIDSGNSIAAAASGNPIGLLTPKLSPDRNLRDQYLTQGFFYTRRVIEYLAAQGYGIEHDWCGVLCLDTHDRLKNRFNAIQKKRELPIEFAEFISLEQASKIAGIPLFPSAILGEGLGVRANLWLPQAGIVNPQSLCHAMIQSAQATLQLDTTVKDIQRHQDCWVLFDENGNVICETSHVVIANANSANQFSITQHLPIKAIPGQLTLCPINSITAQLKVALAYEGYITPSFKGEHIIGATYRHHTTDLSEKAEDHHYNLSLLQQRAPQLTNSFSMEDLRYRTAHRAVTPDHLPLVGPVADYQQFTQQFAKLHHGELIYHNQMVDYLPGLYINAGHGSNGLSSTLLAGEIIASQILGNSLPIPKQVYYAIHPLRHWVRMLKRK